MDKLDITQGDLQAATPDTEMRMRHMMISSAVSYHEEYLTTVLEDFLIRSVKVDRFVSIGLRLNEVGSGGMSKAEIERRAAESVVNDVIGSRYGERFNRIAKLIKDVNGKNVRDYWDDDRLGSAPFEVRNCIIHSAGIADTRTVAELTWLFPGLSVGVQLPIDEGKLWTLLGSLRDVARAIDAATRQ